MTALANFLFPVPVRHRSAAAVWRWWEERRLTYNLIVGAIGVVTVTVVSVIVAIPGGIPGPPPIAQFLAVAAVYGVLANLCYCLGPLTESALNWLWEDDAPRAGPALYRQGLGFSVGLTLLPILIFTAGNVLELLAGLARLLLR